MTVLTPWDDQFHFHSGRMAFLLPAIVFVFRGSGSCHTLHWPHSPYFSLLQPPVSVSESRQHWLPVGTAQIVQRRPLGVGHHDGDVIGLAGDAGDGVFRAVGIGFR